jgi:hypothetical protein
VSDALTEIPSALVAGDSLSVTLTRSAYPAASGWSVSFAMAGPSETIVKTLAASGDSHVLTLGASETEPMAAGVWTYRLRATKSGESTTFEVGKLSVTRDLATFGAGETLSYAAQMLAACKEARKDILSGQFKSYLVAGRQVAFHSLDELAREQARWQAAVSAETSGSVFRSAPVGFVRR